MGASSSSVISGRSSPPPPSEYSLPLSEKYTSNTVSNARQWVLFFTNVAASAYLNASRFSIGMCVMASIASRFSVRLTGNPAARSSTMNPDRSSSIGEEGTSVEVIAIQGYQSARTRDARPFGSTITLKLFRGFGDVALILQENVQRFDRVGFGNGVDTKKKQRSCPIEGL
ncbi:unannotated protein [freshwater metagenome]|uniref:Unannotated protein n=1 Tax=freshwater metagenome TaxID=449393 RepID=A0A6J7LGK3_9ZZZZ